MNVHTLKMQTVDFDPFHHNISAWPINSSHHEKIPPLYLHPPSVPPSLSASLPPPSCFKHAASLQQTLPTSLMQHTAPSTRQEQRMANPLSVCLCVCVKLWTRCLAPKARLCSGGCGGWCHCNCKYISEEIILVYFRRKGVQRKKNLRAPLCSQSLKASYKNQFIWSHCVHLCVQARSLVWGALSSSKTSLVQCIQSGLSGVFKGQINLSFQSLKHTHTYTHIHARNLTAGRN